LTTVELLEEEEEFDEDGHFDKIMMLYRLRLNGVLHPLRLYGQGELVDMVIDELVTLGVKLHLELYGIDIPYQARDFSNYY